MSTLDHDRASGPKRQWQFSLGTLLIAMAWVAVTCIALKAPNELWSGVVFTVAMGSLLAAALLIVYRSGRTRAFAIGFLIFGAAYLGISFGDTPDVPGGRPQLPTTRWAIGLYTLVHGDRNQTSTTMTPIYSAQVPAPYRATQIVAAPPTATASYEVVTETVVGPALLAPSAAPSLAVPSPATSMAYTSGVTPPTVAYVSRTVRQPLVALASFLEVAHHSLVVLLGVIGGIVAQVLYSTRREESRPAREGA